MIQDDKKCLKKSLLDDKEGLKEDLLTALEAYDKATKEEQLDLAPKIISGISRLQASDFGYQMLTSDEIRGKLKRELAKKSSPVPCVAILRGCNDPDSNTPADIISVKVLEAPLDAIEATEAALELKHEAEFANGCEVVVKPVADLENWQQAFEIW